MALSEAELDNVLKQVANDYKQDVDEKKAENIKLNWKDLKVKMKSGDIHYFREFLNENINSFDINTSDPKNDNTLLMYAAEMGQYNIAHLLIQYNANINKVNKNTKKNALSYAQQYGYYNIAVLIEFSRIGASLGNEVKNKINLINIQDGIIQNMYKNMDKQTINSIMNYLVDAISNRLPFSDDILNLCWYTIKENDNICPLDSHLYDTMISTYKSIVADTSNKRDWQWLNDYFISSTIWFRLYPYYQDGQQLLFNELLKIIKTETVKQCKLSLSEKIENLKTKTGDIWTRLTEFEYKSSDSESTVARQDCIPNGLKCKYTKKELLSLKPEQSLFDPIHFYDLNNYLDSLIIRANEVEDDFQKDMNSLIDDIKIELKDNNILYKKGPLKKVARCIAKTENDYSNEQFPTSAHLLDINRCSITFNSVDTMLNAINLFISKIGDKQTNKSSIKSIVRCKNGWMAFKDKTMTNYQYVDIKLNVMIESSKTNHAIIGEIQFTMDWMVKFKSTKSHALYSVERLNEFSDNFTEISPFLMDKNKQLFTLAINGDTKGISKYIINNNIKSNELLNIINDKNQTVLAPICEFNHLRCLKLIINNYSDNDTLIKGLITGDTFVGDTPIDYAFKKNAIDVIKFLLQKYPEIMLKHNESIHFAMRFDDVNFVKLYLDNIDVENVAMDKLEKKLNNKFKNDSPLMNAMKYGSKNCMKIWIEWIINNKKNNKLLKSVLFFNTKSGDIPFTFLCSNGYIDCISLLFDDLLWNDDDNKKLIKEQIWYKNNAGNNCFMKAILKNQIKSAKFILDLIETNEEKVKYLKVENKKNETAAKIAIRRENPQLAETIKEWIIEYSP